MEQEKAAPVGEVIQKQIDLIKSELEIGSDPDREKQLIKRLRELRLRLLWEIDKMEWEIVD